MKLTAHNVTVEWAHTDGSWVKITDDAPATDYAREAFLQGDEAEELIDYILLAADGPFSNGSLAEAAVRIGIDYLP